MGQIPNLTISIIILNGNGINIPIKSIALLDGQKIRLY